MKSRTRLLVPILMLLVASLSAIVAVPSIALADTLTWSPPFYGPANIINGDSETQVASALNAVSFADTTRGWAVGLRVDNPSNGTHYASFAFTDNGGQSWSNSTILGVTAELHGVVALSPTKVWAVGQSGTILKYNGVSWETKTVSNWPTSKALRAIAFSGSNGWAVGDGYGVAITTNGGDSWSTLVQPGTTGTLRAVAAAGPGAYAVGDSAYGSGSAIMKYLTTSSSTAKIPGTGNALYGIAFADADHGWAVGANATFVRTTNGGATWSVVPVPPIPKRDPLLSANSLRAIAFADASNGVAVGVYQGVWRTTDGGASWTVEDIVDGGLGDYDLRGVAFVPGSAEHPIVVSRALGVPPTFTLTSGSQKSRTYRGTWDVADRTAPTTTSDAQAAYVGPATIHLAATDTGGSGVAHTYWRLDRGVQTEGLTVSTSAAGDHALEFWSVDASSNVETPHNTWDFTVTIPDTTPPTTTSDAEAAYTGTATIRLSATDDLGGSGVAQTLYRLDGAAPVQGVSIEATSAGPHSIEFWSVDVALNEESPHKAAGFTITIPDTTAPTTVSDATTHYDTTATIVLTAVDDPGGSGVAHTYYILDGQAGGTQSEGTTVTASGDGTHTLEFWSVDGAGNPETPHKTANFSIATPAPPDSTAPTTLSDAAPSYTGPATIHLTPTDNFGGSGVAHTWWRLDGGTATEGTTIHTTAAGPHSLEFWSVDVQGNIESHKNVSFSVTIPDTVAPVTISDAQATYMWTAAIHLSASDVGGSGVAHTYWRLDSGTQTEGTSVATGASGEHTLEFWSVDGAGNPETPHKTARFVITSPPESQDTTKPITSWPGWAAKFVTRASIVLSASDGTDGTGVAGTRYRLDAGGETSGTTLTVTKSGAHTLEFWSVDAAGNEEVHKSLNFTVLIATSLTITSNHTIASYGHTIVFSGHVSSNIGTNSHIEVRAKKPGSSTWVKLSTRHSTSTHHWSYSYAPPAKGKWYFQVRYAGTSKYGPSTSSSRAVTVRAVATSLSITSNHTTVTSGHPIVFTGHISSNRPRNTAVKVYARQPGLSTWVYLSTRHTTSTHHWSYTYAPKIKGTWYFQVRYAGTSKYGASTSPSRKITVK
jgi:photosystem II stability/assembly factor-like uncharacterized protein